MWLHMHNLFETNKYSTWHLRDRFSETFTLQTMSLSLPLSLSHYSDKNPAVISLSILSTLVDPFHFKAQGCFRSLDLSPRESTFWKQVDETNSWSIFDRCTKTREQIHPDISRERGSTNLPIFMRELAQCREGLFSWFVLGPFEKRRSVPGYVDRENKKGENRTRITFSGFLCSLK